MRWQFRKSSSRTGVVQTNLNRLKQLRGTDAISSQEYDQGATQVRTTQAAVKNAQAQVGVAQANIETAQAAARGAQRSNSIITN